MTLKKFIKKPRNVLPGYHPTKDNSSQGNGNKSPKYNFNLLIFLNSENNNNVKRISDLVYSFILPIIFIIH